MAGDLEVDAASHNVITAWNLMGGQMDWSAIPVLAALLDIRNPETWVKGLVQVRTYMAATAEDTDAGEGFE